MGGCVVDVSDAEKIGISVVDIRDAEKWGSNGTLQKRLLGTDALRIGAW
jgi:hypothetical protein